MELASQQIHFYKLCKERKEGNFDSHTHTLTNKYIWFKFSHLHTFTLVDGLPSCIWTEVGLCGRPTGKSDTLKGKNPISCPDLLFGSVLTTAGSVTFLDGIQAHKQAASAFIKRVIPAPHSTEHGCTLLCSVHLYDVSYIILDAPD